MAQQIQPLTALRGYASLWVLCFHFFHIYQHLSFTRDIHAAAIPWFQALCDKGYLGVDVFFLLSGFVIVHVYLPFFQAEGLRHRTFVAFIVRRVARIYPLHLFIMLFLLAWSRYFPYPEETSLQTLWYSLSLTQCWGFVTRWAWNAPSWSVSVEWGIYLLFPFVFLLLGRDRYWLSILNKMLLLYLLFCWIGYRFHHGSVDYTLNHGILRGLLEFSIGACLHSLYRQGFLKTLPWNIINPILLAAIASAMWHGVRDFAVVGMLAVFMYSLLFLTGFAARLFTNRASVFLGDVSYSLYLWHMPLFFICSERFYQFFGRALPFQTGSQASLVTALIVFTGWMVAVSCLSYRYIEKPARNAINRWQKTRLPVKAA